MRSNLEEPGILPSAIPTRPKQRGSLAGTPGMALKKCAETPTTGSLRIRMVIRQTS